jgi:hypothetical protein
MGGRDRRRMTRPKQGPPERPCLGHGHCILNLETARLVLGNPVDYYLVRVLSVDSDY